METTPWCLTPRGKEARALNEWWNPSDIAEEIKKRFPKTFSNKPAPKIAWAFPFGARFLHKKGLIEMKEDPKYENRRNYKFKS